MEASRGAVAAADADLPWRRVAAVATRIFRGDTSRRGRDADVLRRRVAAAATRTRRKDERLRRRYRSDRDYEQAIKSYKQALKIDADNVQILRDLSLLQIQLRDQRGFLKTRHKLLTQKPNNKMHWIAYALANHLAGFRATAIQVIDAYGETLNGQEREPRSYEDSELQLYRTDILEEDGRAAEALTHLESVKEIVVDGYGFHKKRAELLLYAEAGREPDPTKGPADATVARGAWADLLRRPTGSDNYHFHRGFQCAVLGLDGASSKRLLKELDTTRTPTDVVALDAETLANLEAAYAQLAKENPRSDALLWLPVTFRPAGAAFEARLDEIVVKFLRRGAPALGAAFERLWAPKPGDVVEGRSRGAACCRAVLARADAHAASLDATGRFDASSDENAPPTARAWASYFLAARIFCVETSQRRRRGRGRGYFYGDDRRRRRRGRDAGHSAETSPRRRRG